MLAPYFGYWGKADPGVGGYHLAVFHCLDVAAVCEELLRRDAVLRRKLAGMTRLDESRVVPTIATFVALHDFGKFDGRFQAKAPEVLDAIGHPEWKVIDGRGFDHGGAGYRHLLALREEDPQGFRNLLGNEGALALLAGSCGHHGVLPSSGESDCVPGGWNRRLSHADKTARNEWLRDVVKLFREQGATLPLEIRADMALVELLAGLCSVTDWLGSQVEYGGRSYFTYESVPRPIEEYLRDRARPVAKCVLDDVPLAAAEPSGRRFRELFVRDDGAPFEPRGVQCVTEELKLDDGPCLVIVEAAMGSGKTEAALALASRMMGRGDARGLYVALPTMATSNGMFRRIERVAPRLFDGGVVNLRLAHGRALQNDAFDRLVERSLRGRLARGRAQHEAEAEVVCAKWFLSGKRALLGQIGVGTVDQAMLAALKLRHNFVRIFGLGVAVVVIDEVHAYDAYMEVVLERLVEWLGGLRTPAILLSATLPAERRRLFVEAYRRGLGAPTGTSMGACTAAPESAPYPLVTLVSAQGVTECSLASEGSVRSVEQSSRVVKVELRGRTNPLDDVLPELLDAVRAGAMVAWVRNTVDEAREAFERARELADERGLPLGKVRLFHARFRGCDRAQIERQVLARFGPEGCDARDGELLIATQVIEQSLDLDFDFLVTDLCPIDLLFQRIGRLWRHEWMPRPAESKERGPTVMVVAPDEKDSAALRFGPSAHVYDPVTLWLAYDEIAARKGQLVIPDDIRPAVERSYAARERVARIEAAPNRALLKTAEERLQRTLADLRDRAKRACIPCPRDGVQITVGNFPDDDESERALTRHGESVSLLPVFWDDSEGVGRSLGAVDDATNPPWRLDPEASDAWREVQRLQDDVVTVMQYEWDPIVGAAAGKGEAAVWEQWRERCRTFLDEMGLRRVIVVPMSLDRSDAGLFKGRVERTSGSVRVRYAQDRGLWWMKE